MSLQKAIKNISSIKNVLRKSQLFVTWGIRIHFAIKITSPLTQTTFENRMLLRSLEQQLLSKVSCPNTQSGNRHPLPLVP